LKDTKYELKDEVYVLHNNSIYRAKVETVTKTEVIEGGSTKGFPEAQETYGLKLIKGEMRITRTNNVGDLYVTVEEVLNSIKIIE
tara:strand:- start:117 stop:371 length:255 start_codon:yes stop_codon:yes gene_type:complete